VWELKENVRCHHYRVTAGAQRVAPGGYFFFFGGGEPGEGGNQWKHFFLTKQVQTIMRALSIIGQASEFDLGID